MAIITTYNCDGLTGGGERDLDTLSVGDLLNNDRAVVETDGKVHRFYYDSTSTEVEDIVTHPYKVRPNDYVDAGVWIELSFNFLGTTVDLGDFPVYAGNLNYNEGLLSDPTITNAAGVNISVTSVVCLIRSDATWNDGKLYRKTVAQNTSLAVTDNSINYIYVNWNDGTPIYAATTDRSVMNNSNYIPVARVYMESGDIKYQIAYQYIGRAAAIRNFDRVMKIRGSAGIERESGFAITETGTRVVNVASGYAWFGLSRKTLDAVVQGVAASELWYHVAGVWTHADITDYNNTQYDNGTALATLTANRYGVNWIYRNVTTDEIDIVLGNGDYTIAQATASQVPPIPTSIANFYVSCGRIIVQKTSDTAYAIQNVSTSAFFKHL